MPPGPAASAASRRLRLRRCLLTKTEKTQIRQRLLFAAGVLQLLAIALIIAVNVGGLRPSVGSILAPDTYLLAWTNQATINETGVVESRLFTLYWYLNSFCLRNGDSPSLAVVANTTATDFIFEDLDTLFLDYLDTHYACNTTAPSYVPKTTTLTPDETSLPRACRRNTSDGLYLPAALLPSPHLSAGPPFGSVSFAMYITATILALLSWTLHLLGRSYRPLRTPPSRRKRTTNITAFVQTTVAVLAVAAAGLLSTGIDAVVARHAGVVQRNWSGVAFVWCAAVGMGLGSGFYGVAVWMGRDTRNRGMVVVGGDSRRRTPAMMRMVRSSLPTYRPREGEGDDDLPPYQREDPLGNPPGIGERHVLPTVVVMGGGGGGFPMESLGVGIGSVVSQVDRGRETPSPEYRETIDTVEPVSPLSRQSGRQSDISSGLGFQDERRQSALSSGLGLHDGRREPPPGEHRSISPVTVGSTRPPSSLGRVSSMASEPDDDTQRLNPGSQDAARR